MANLLFVVPFRRAVVQEHCTYAAALKAWQDPFAATDAKSKLEAWYGNLPRYSDAMAWLTNFILGIQRDGRNHLATLSARSRATINNTTAFARLWKGPWRVLHGDDDDTTWQGAHENRNREARSPSAEFFPGDLLEFPLHRFLAVAGHGSRSDLFNLRFNGEGSPFLGTSVKTPDGEIPTGAVALHDNLPAMRFQLLLNMAIGAFSHGTQVWDCQSQAKVAHSGNSVFARGMMYAGLFSFEPKNPLSRCPGPRWKGYTGHWGVSREGDLGSLPTPESLEQLCGCVWSGTRFGNEGASLHDLPMTPGWTCSPMTISLSSILMNHDHFLSNNVGVHWKEHLPEGVTQYSPREVAERLGLPTDPGQLPTVRQSREVDLLPSDGAFPGDFAIMSMNAHERALIRLRPHGALLDAEERPRAGSFAAYDPFTGQDYCAGASEKLYQFEAAGARGRWYVGRRDDRYLFGAGPFLWAPTANSGRALHFYKVTSRRGSAKMSFYYQRPRQSRLFLDTLFCVDQAAATANACPEGEPLPSVRLHGDRSGAPEMAPCADLYAQRSIPFPTLSEVESSGRYATLGDMHERAIAARDSLAEETEGTAEGLRALHDSLPRAQRGLFKTYAKALGHPGANQL